MSPQTVTRRFPRSSPYWPVITHPLLRRVLPGLAVSALGDGMTLVAVTWLALQLAPAKQQGTWVAIAVAAYSLPSAAGALVFGRFLRGRIGWSSAAAVIAIDAATFAVLAATYRLALPRVVRADPVEAGASRAAGFAVIRHDRTLRGLLALTFAFFFLFGPVLVALPIHITQDLHGSATLLGPLD